MAPFFRSGRHPRQRGFVYLTAMFLLAVLVVTSARVFTNWRTHDLREREEELLYVGEQYRRAIQIYYELTPSATKRYPSRLEDLLEDRRGAQLRRPLRRLFPDPLTRSTGWGLVRADDGGIQGVYSLSTAAPVKIGGFSGPQLGFNGAKEYQQWKFVYLPPS
jgi:type II secretory pathway pseudopilin PulG